MPVIPYLPADIEEPRELVTAIRARRGGTLLNLDRMLLHSPPFAAAWNAFLGGVRQTLDAPSKLRELAICVVALLNDAEYEFIQHGPEFLKAGGTGEQLEWLKNLPELNAPAGLFNPAEYAIIRLTCEMTRNIHVSPATADAVLAELDSPQHYTEIVGVIATYNMVSRYLVAMGIEPERREKS